MGFLPKTSRKQQVHAFDRIAQSADAFFKRFKIEPTIEGQSRVVIEEAREFLQAADRISLLGDLFRALQNRRALPAGAKYETFYDTMAEHDETFRRNVAKEYADMVYSGYALCRACGLTKREIEQGLIDVAAENDEKNEDTHEVKNGKVTRKV